MRKAQVLAEFSIARQDICHRFRSEPEIEIKRGFTGRQNLQDLYHTI